MAHLIDKDALVAEIERIKKEECPIDTYEGRIKLFYFERFLSFLDTLEVKEVNLEKEVTNWLNDRYKKINDDYEFGKYNGHYMENSTIISLAKHFFELGFKTKVDDALVEEIYSHIDSIKDTADIMTSGNFMH